MEALKRVLEAARGRDDARWRAYKTVRSLAELAGRVLIERGLPAPLKCRELPQALERAGVLTSAEARELGELIAWLRRAHRGGEGEAERAVEAAVALAQRLARAAARRYPQALGGAAYALRRFGASAAYEAREGDTLVVAVRAEGLDLEARVGLAAELAEELGEPPERIVVRTVEEALEAVLRSGRLIYAEDYDEEIELLGREYEEALCC